MVVTSIVGAIFSVIGAIVAIRQARKARKYKDELLRDRKKMLLIDVFGLARRARDECGKMLPTGSKRARRGVDSQQAISSIRECLDRIKDNEHKLTDPKLDAAIAATQHELQEYVRDNDESRRFAVAQKMYNSLSEIIRNISKGIDSEL